MQAGEQFLERDLSQPAGCAGEHRGVVGQDRCWQTVAFEPGLEVVDDIGAGDGSVCARADQEPGVVIEDVEDLDLGVVGEEPVGGVGLPAFVGLVGGEAHVGRLGTFEGLGGDEPATDQGPPDRRGCGDLVEFVLEVPGDGVRTGVEPVVDELFTELDDALFNLGWCPTRVAVWSARSRLEPGIALGVVAG